MEDKLDIYLTGQENLFKCFDLATNIHQKYIGYKVVNNKKGLRMYIYWCNPDNMMAKSEANWFPYEMDSKEISNFVWGWLKRADYGDEPDTDGGTGKGFHFVARDFGDLLDGCDEYAVGVIVTPVWFVYGK